MFKISVMYPNQEEAKFDLEYYHKEHMKLVEKHLKPYGLVKTTVEKGISGGANQPPPYICIEYLYFETEEGYDKGIAETGNILRGDIKNYTNITPIRQISQIL